MEDQGPAGSSHVDEPSEVSELEASPLRSCWEFASVVQFCRLFGSTLKIRPFSADLLERAVLHPATHPIFLSDLCVKLLRANVQQPPTEKELDAWNEQLARRLACNWPVSFESDPLETEAFQDVQPITRVSAPRSAVGAPSSSAPAQQGCPHPPARPHAGAHPVRALRLAHPRLPHRQGGHPIQGACRVHRRGVRSPQQSWRPRVTPSPPLARHRRSWPSQPASCCATSPSARTRRAACISSSPRTTRTAASTRSSRRLSRVRTRPHRAALARRTQPRPRPRRRPPKTPAPHRVQVTRPAAS